MKLKSFSPLGLNTAIYVYENVNIHKIFLSGGTKCDREKYFEKNRFTFFVMVK